MIYLSDKNTIYVENATSSVAQNLILSKFTQISNFTIEDFRSKLKVFSLTAPTDTTYMPNKNEQTLYFGLNNSNWAIRENNGQLSSWFVNETTKSADSKI